MVARNCATSYLRVSSRAGCMARASPRIACFPVSSLHALVTTAAVQSLASFGSPSFLRYRLRRVRKQSSISRPRRTWPRPRGSTLQVSPDHAVVAGTRRPICFVAVAAQRGIGRHEGEWWSAVGGEPRIALNKYPVVYGALLTSRHQLPYVLMHENHSDA
jgi:hypothetical protein